MGALEPLTIAYVEDDPNQVRTMQELLGRWLVNPVEVYSHGRALLERLTQSTVNRTPKPGIVLVDLTLPDIDGTEIVRRIKNDHLDMIRVPKIIVTGYDNDEAVQSARQAGADGYIVKPVKIHALMGVLNKVAPYGLQIVART